MERYHGSSNLTELPCECIALTASYLDHTRDFVSLLATSKQFKYLDCDSVWFRFLKLEYQKAEDYYETRSFYYRSPDAVDKLNMKQSKKQVRTVVKKVEYDRLSFEVRNNKPRDYDQLFQQMDTFRARFGILCPFFLPVIQEYYSEHSWEQFVNKMLDYDLFTSTAVMKLVFRECIQSVDMTRQFINLTHMYPLIKLATHINYGTVFFNAKQYDPRTLSMLLYEGLIDGSTRVTYRQVQKGIKQWTQPSTMISMLKQNQIRIDPFSIVFHEKETLPSGTLDLICQLLGQQVIHRSDGGYIKLLSRMLTSEYRMQYLEYMTLVFTLDCKNELLDYLYASKQVENLLLKFRRAFSEWIADGCSQDHELFPSVDYSHVNVAKLVTIDNHNWGYAKTSDVIRYCLDHGAYCKSKTQVLYQLEKCMPIQYEPDLVLIIEQLARCENVKSEKDGDNLVTYYLSNYNWFKPNLYEMICKFLELGADASHVNSWDGRSILHSIALNVTRNDVLLYLKAVLAKVENITKLAELKDKEGKTALDYLSEKSPELTQAVISEFDKHRQVVNQPLVSPRKIHQAIKIVAPVVESEVDIRELIRDKTRERTGLYRNREFQ